MLTNEGTDFFDIEMAHYVNPTQSTHNVTLKKIEIKLKKESDGYQWMGLANTTGQAPPKVGSVNVPQIPLTGGQPMAYPSSSKKKSNFADMDKQIKNELKDFKEGDGLNDLFKQIYGRADEETRKAMIKSYQTSGGTVLSTNWGEVKDKDYEGKDRPEAPKGQVWADEIGKK